MENAQTNQPASGSDGADARYFAALATSRFEIPRCEDCQQWHFFPRVSCPYCGSEALRWAEPSGAGTVYSTTIVRRPDHGDYTVCLIDLAEGPRMMSRVVDVPTEEVHIGQAVRARVDHLAEGPLLVFVAAPGSTS